jgi:hypothetical protein
MLVIPVTNRAGSARHRRDHFPARPSPLMIMLTRPGHVTHPDN